MHKNSYHLNRRAPGPGSHDANNRPARGPGPKWGGPDPTTLASALKVRNFRQLLSRIGEEQLAVALDFTIGRVKELSDGINFSAETAHHIEFSLGLSSGFMDMVNPALSEADVERIRNLQPVDLEDLDRAERELAESQPSATKAEEELSTAPAISAKVSSEPAPSLDASALARFAEAGASGSGMKNQEDVPSTAVPPNASAESAVQEAPAGAQQQDSKVSEDSPPSSPRQAELALNLRPRARADEAGVATSKAPLVLRKLSRKSHIERPREASAPERPSLTQGDAVLEEKTTPTGKVYRISPATLQSSQEMLLNDEETAMKNASPAQGPDANAAALPEVRRQNLMVLTSRSGAKAQLARLTGLSAANVSHRLHGNKLFDEETASFFCDRLGLPQGWFDAPHEESEVPQAVLKLLSDKNSVPLSSAPAPKTRAPRTKSEKNLAPVSAAAETTLKVPGKRGRPRKNPEAAVPAPASAALSPQVAKVASQPAAPAAPAASRPSAPAAQPAAPVSLPPAQEAAIAAANKVKPVAAAVNTVSTRLGDRVLEASPHIGPIAEALVKTLAAKSEQGRLTEDRALQMLMEIAAL